MRLEKNAQAMLEKEEISCSFRDISLFASELMKKVIKADKSEELPLALRGHTDKTRSKALLEVVSEMGVPVEVVMGRIKYYRGRKIDR